MSREYNSTIFKENTMTKLFLMAFCTLLYAADTIQLGHARLEPLGEIVRTNAKITQLSNQKQQVVSLLGGHIEAYYVEPGEMVRKGDRIALIQSLELSRMTAEYLALVQQLKAAAYDLDTAKSLYAKGVGSRQERNAKMIALQEIKSKKNTLSSQLLGLGIDPGKLKKATDELVLYAHADGVVGELLAPLHTTVDARTSLAILVNQSGYYALAYLDIDDAMKITPKATGWVTLADKRYPCSFVQLLPEVDSETQRAQVLFRIGDDPKKLLLGAFTQIEITIPPYHNAVTVKKSALSLFNGEWVLFIPGEEEEHHDTQQKEEAGHSKEDLHEGGEAHTHKEEKHEEVPYVPQVVKIIAYYGDKVAVDGIRDNEAYVSDGVYFVKSMLLKSSLGEHGH